MDSKEKGSPPHSREADGRLISLFSGRPQAKPAAKPGLQSAFSFPEDPPSFQAKGGHPPLRFILEDDNEAVRWRRRAVFLICVFGEAVLILLLLWTSSLMQRHERFVQLQAAEEEPQQQTTFLEMPPDLLKELKSPKTNVLSDQNRRARGPSPVVNPNGLHMPRVRGNTKLPQLAGGERAKTPAAPPVSTPAPGSSPATAKGPRQMAKAIRPPQQPQQQSQLALSNVPPPPSASASANPTLGMVTPGESIQQSLQAVAQGRSMGTVPGPGLSPYQLNNPNPNFSTSGPIILSNTRGVDFGPYLAQILEIVRENWYAVIPESARLGEKGESAVVFEILKDGSVPQLRLVASSGKSPLDRAAMAGIRASIPFPPLPSEFTGRHLVLQFNFFYNMAP